MDYYNLKESIYRTIDIIENADNETLRERALYHIDKLFDAEALFFGIEPSGEVMTTESDISLAIPESSAELEPKKKSSVISDFLFGNKAVAKTEDKKDVATDKPKKERKPWSEEARKAASERMKARRAKGEMLGRQRSSTLDVEDRADEVQIGGIELRP